MKYLEIRELTYFNGETHALVYSTETNKYSIILKEYDKNHNIVYDENDKFTSSLEYCIVHIIDNTFKSIVNLANVFRKKGFESVALVKSKQIYNNGTIDIIEKEYYTLKANITDLKSEDIILNVYNLTDKEDFESLVEQVKRLSNEEYQKNFMQFMK